MGRGPILRFPAQIPQLWGLGMPVGFREAQKHPSGHALEISRAEPGRRKQAPQTARGQARSTESKDEYVPAPGPPGAHGLTDTDGHSVTATHRGGGSKGRRCLAARRAGTLLGTGPSRCLQDASGSGRQGEGEGRQREPRRGGGWAELSTDKGRARGPRPHAECEEAGEEGGRGGGRAPG